MILIVCYKKKHGYMLVLSMAYLQTQMAKGSRYDLNVDEENLQAPKVRVSCTFTMTALSGLP